MYGDGPWGVPGYTEVRALGAGASGRVVLARRDYDDVEVAIKYLGERLRSDVGFVARFRHEARLLGALRSPHHARLIDYVESGQGAAIIMELVNGVSLREILKSEGPTGAEAALTVLKGSLQGLAAAHAIGVVHRDYKPENVMVESDGASKLVDFGIAVRTGEDADATGTPPYMAPEQWSGERAGPSTDVYAATVVFFECLTGTRPFRAADILAMAHQHLTAPPPVEQVPPPLRGLVERGLAKNPAERPPSAEAFLTELEAVAVAAYGEDWEDRGRRRLGVLAALLAALFPAPLDEPAETETALTETRLREPSRLLSKLPAKIAVGVTAVGALVAAVTITVNAMSHDEAALRAETSQIAPTTAVPTTAVPATPEGVETDEELTPVPEKTTPEPSASDTPPSVQPTATQPVTSQPTASPATSERPATRTPTPARASAETRRPAPSRAPTPQASPRITVDVPDRKGVTPQATARPTQAPSSAPAPTRTFPGPPRPTQQPTQQPTTQPPDPTGEPGGGETTDPPRPTEGGDGQIDPPQTAPQRATAALAKRPRVADRRSKR